MGRVVNTVGFLLAISPVFLWEQFVPWYKETINVAIGVAVWVAMQKANDYGWSLAWVITGGIITFMVATFVWVVLSQLF